MGTGWLIADLLAVVPFGTLPPAVCPAVPPVVVCPAVEVVVVCPAVVVVV